MISQNLIAHRGWRNRFPENTAIAIEKAIEIGAQNVEIDIQLTADHIPYLAHDQQLLRLCNSTQEIGLMTAMELTSLSAYEPQRLGQAFINTPLCSLTHCVQILSKHPQITLYAEIKGHSIEKFGVETCLAAILPELKPIHQHCVIISFDVNILLHAKKAGWNRVGAVLSNWRQAFNNQLSDLAPEIIFCDNNLLTGNKTPADPPFPVAIYEVGSYPEAKSLLQQGAKLIETFCIGELIKEDKNCHTSSTVNDSF